MRLYNDTLWNLLFAVHGIVSEALPIPSAAETSSSVLVADNHIIMLRTQIRMMSLHLSNEVAAYELSGKAFGEVCGCIRAILTYFESLIDESILTGVDSIKSDELKKFPKLATLRYKSLEGNIATISSLVSFEKDSPYYDLTKLATSNFNGTMSKVFPKLGREANVQGNDHDLWKLNELSTDSEELFEILRDTACDKVENPHKAYFRLSCFETYEYEMMFSLCDRTDLWHSLYVSHQRFASVETRGSSIGNLCNEMQRSAKNKRTSHMLFKKSDICKSSDPATRIKVKPQPPRETLRQIFQKEQESLEALCKEAGLSRNQIRRPRILTKSEKQVLGLLIATSLLYLYGSSMIQNIWSAENIYVQNSISRPKNSIPEAYISFCLNPDPAKKSSISENSGGDPSVLALTAILLELELEEEVTIGADDKDEWSENPSLFVALCRLHDDLDDEFDLEFHDIIEACLQLYVRSSETELEDYSRIMRNGLLKTVITPLKTRNERYTNFKKFKYENVSHNQNYSILEPHHTQENLFGTKESLLKTVVEIPEEQGSKPPSFSAYSNGLAGASGHQLLTSGGNISSSGQWLERVDGINANLDKIMGQNLTCKKVKIAILDTGCDLHAGCIIVTRAEALLKGRWHDFVEDSKTPVDEDTGRHGTALVALLLRVAIHAEVFVARVARNKDGLQIAENSISRAIEHARSNWDVDVISMSFGFSRHSKVIDCAIEKAVRKRKKENRDIIFLAAANNNGSNEMELFPASHSSVISVRGTDYAGGFPRSYDPPPSPVKDNIALFGTLGVDVPYDKGDPSVQMSGCSLATPIMAGIIAMIIHDIDNTRNEDTLLCTKLRRRKGILQVLQDIATEERNKRRYVAPWFFFRKKDEDREALVRNALSNLEP